MTTMTAIATTMVFLGIPYLLSSLLSAANAPTNTQDSAKAGAQPS